MMLSFHKRASNNGLKHILKSHDDDKNPLTISSSGAKTEKPVIWSSSGIIRIVFKVHAIAWYARSLASIQSVKKAFSGKALKL